MIHIIDTLFLNNGSLQCKDKDGKWGDIRVAYMHKFKPMIIEDSKVKAFCILDCMLHGEEKTENMTKRDEVNAAFAKGRNILEQLTAELDNKDLDNNRT